MDLQKIMHVATIRSPAGLKQYLVLRQMAEHHYTWFLHREHDEEEETGVWAPTISEAIQLAKKGWHHAYFKQIGCGYRYHLPERDEHGENALFYQMVASYHSATGVYFDQIEGHNCIVQNASQEAKALMKKLKCTP